MAEQEVAAATTETAAETNTDTTSVPSGRNKRTLQDLEPQDDVADEDSPDAKRVKLDDENNNKSDGLASETGFGKDEKLEENVVVEKFEEDSVKEEQAESDTVEEAVTEEEESNAEVHEEVDDTKADDSQTTSRKIEVPKDKVGVLTSKGGDTIKSLQYLSGAKIQITRDMDAEPHSTTRPVELIGTLSSTKMAEKLINVVIEADAGGSPSLVARGLPRTQTIEVGDQIEMEIPNDRVTLLLGRGGDTINAFEADSGARIELSYEDFLDGSIKWTVRLSGKKEQIEVARAMVQDIATRDWMDPRLTGGYRQQSFRSMPQIGKKSHPPQAQPHGSRHPATYSQTQHGNYQPLTSQRGYGFQQQPSVPVSNLNSSHARGPALGMRYPQQLYGRGYPQSAYQQPTIQYGYNSQQQYRQLVSNPLHAYGLVPGMIHPQQLHNHGHSQSVYQQPIATQQQPSYRMRPPQTYVPHMPPQQ